MTLIIENDNLYPLSNGDRWTPKLNGEIFCSPACGGRCKKKDFDRATELAGVVIAKLGRGWTPHIWENLGWYFEVKKGVATVTLEQCGNYSATVQFSFNDSVNENITEEDEDPRVAVEKVIDVLNKKIAILKRSLISISFEQLEIEDV